MNIYSKFSAYITICLFLLLHASVAHASSPDIDAVSKNIVASTQDLPGLVSALSYILGVAFGILAIFKLKEHVEVPTGAGAVPLRTPLIRFAVAGALFALPIIFEAAFTSINGNGAADTFSHSSVNTNANLSTPMSTLNAVLPIAGINQLMQNLIGSIDETPGIITALAYLLGILSCVSGLLKLREHVETPEQIQMKEFVIRLLIGGTMFALPTIFNAAYNTVIGDSSIFSAAYGGLITNLNFFISSFAPTGALNCTAAAATGGLGSVMCEFVSSASAAPAFLEAISYIFGMVIALWAILKIRDHVLSPQQTSVWEGGSRLLTAGAFFALPYIAEVLRSSIAGDGFGSGYMTFLTDGNSSYKHSATVAAQCTGGLTLSLDFVMGCFMHDIMAPVHILLNFFAWVAGLVLIMIGISRIMKSSQDGARGPGGLGTMMTFMVGGILISYNAILGAVSTALFASSEVETEASLSYSTGMSTAEIQHVEIVAESIIQFMIIIGLISFVRGWFIMRDVAEGSQQASAMAGSTHIIAGALAVNLGPLLNVIQTTFNITGVGMSFS